MSTTLVTLTGNVSDALGVDFNPAQTKVRLTYNTDIVSTDDGYRLGTAYVKPDENGDWELVDVVAETNAVDNLQVTITYDYVDRVARAHTTPEVGTYDLTGLSGTIELSTLDETQYAPGERTSTILAEMEALRDEVAEISGLTGEDAAVAALVGDTDSDTAIALSDSFVGTGSDVRTALNAKVRRARPQMVLTFDDAPLTDWTVVKPILDAANVKGVFCLTTDNVPAELTWAHATSLAAAGHELVAHSASHANLGSANAGDVADEVTDAFAAILTNTGTPAAGFCYPFGANNALVRDEVRRLGSFGLGDTVEGTNTQPFATYNLLRRHIENGRSYATYTGWVDDAVATDALLIILVHSGYDFNATQQGYLADLIDYAQAEGMEITTLSEALGATGNVLDAGDYPKATGTVISGEGLIAYSPNVGPAAVMSAVDLSTTNQGSYAPMATTVTAVASTTGKILVRIDGHSSNTSAGSTQFFSCSGNNSAGTKYFADLIYASTARYNHAGAVVYTGLTPGTSYTFTIGVKVDAGTWNCRCAAYPENEAFTVSAFQVA